MSAYAPSATALRPPQIIDRHYGLDWLRIIAFSLLILHHVGRAFVNGDWLVKLADIDWLTGPMLLVTPWRLALLFVIAGFASRAMWSRVGTRAFLQERTLRLILPLVAAMLVIIPPQSWINLVFNHDYPASFGHFLAHDAFAFRAWDGVTQPGWEHLWFVFYLWAYTMLLGLALLSAPAALRRRATGAVSWLLQGRRLLWLPLLYFVPARVGVAFTLGESHGLFDDWVSDLIYLPCFLIGFALAGCGRELWAAIGRCWRPALVVAAAAYLLTAGIETNHPGDAQLSHGLAALDRAGTAIEMWAAVLLLLRLADTLLNRDHPWRARLSEAVFPFYIIHQTIIVVVAWALLGRGLSTGAEFLVLVCTTISGCWLFYRLGDLVPAIRPLIGLKPRAKARAAPARPAEAG